MKKIWLSLFAFTFLLQTILIAQTSSVEYKAVDEFVQKLGALDSQNVASIAAILTRQIDNNELKARAIFYWIANNIELDGKAIKINDERKSLPEDIIQYRKATGLGFAKLFQEMSSIANIRCLVVDGYIKNNNEEINNPPDEKNHSWNVLQLGQSPEQWFYIDVASASGFLDKKKTQFTKAFTSEYFFADKLLFNLDHYPDNDAWQLGGGPRNLKDFYNLPVFYSTAYQLGFKKPAPYNGFIKTKLKAKVNFSFPYTGNVAINEISLLIGEGRRQQKPEPMNFTASAGTINFNYQFKTEDSYPVKILINGKPAIEYLAEVTE